MYLSGRRSLNPVELSDNLVRRLEGAGHLQDFARAMGAVTMAVGLVQGMAS